MRRYRLDPRKRERDATDWAKLRARSDRSVEKAARADPDARPLTAVELKRMLPLPDVRALRRGLGLTQAAFARRFRLALGTVRDWEQRRYPPEGSARVLLAVIEHDPDVVAAAIRAKIDRARRKPSVRAAGSW